MPKICFRAAVSTKAAFPEPSKAYVYSSWSMAQKRLPQVPLLYAQALAAQGRGTRGSLLQLPFAERKQLAASWEEGGMGSPCPSPRASCVEAGPQRALFSTLRTHKEQSEKHGGSTSEGRKDRKGQRRS